MPPRAFCGHGRSDVQRLDRSRRRPYSRPTIPAVREEEVGHGRAGPHRSTVSTSAIFEPLRFRNLTVKNRIFRSSTGGRWDTYDGSGTQTRINWDLKTARGGVGAIISSHAPVHPRGRLLPGYALIDRDDRVPFWRELDPARARARLQVHRPAGARGPRADHRRLRVPEGRQLDRRARAAQRLPVRAPDDCRDPRARRRVRRRRTARPRGRRRRRRARRRERRPLHPVPELGRSTTARTSTAARWRTAPASPSTSSRAVRAEVGDDFFLGFKISIRERMNEILPWLSRGNSRRGVGAGLQVARGSRASTASTSASAASSRTRATRRATSRPETS